MGRVANVAGTYPALVISLLRLFRTLSFTHTPSLAPERLFLPFAHSLLSLLSLNLSTSISHTGQPHLRLDSTFSGSPDNHHTSVQYSKYDEGEEYEMVQTYGIAPDSGAEPAQAGSTGETNALLGENRDSTTNRDVRKREGHASLGSCISNLANTIIGSGEFSAFLSRRRLN